MTDDEVAIAIAELKSKDSADRLSAMADLSEVDRPDVRDALVGALRGIQIGKSGQDYEVSPLIGTLAGFGDRRVIPLILKILDQDLDTGEDHQIETAAAEALSLLGATEALPLLVDKLLDASFSEGIEGELASAIATIGGDAWAHVLMKALTSRRTALAVAAANALAGITSPSVDPALQRAADSEDGELRTAAQIALIMRSNDPEDGLRALLSTGGSPGWQSDVIFALRRMNRPALSAVLLGVLDDKPWADWRFVILELLVKQRVPDVAAALEKVFSTPPTTPWIRGTAAALQLQLGFRPDLADFLLQLAVDPAAIARSADSRPNEFDSAELVVEVLSTVLPQDPPRFYRWITLLDAHRRREPKLGKLQQVAGMALSKIVGSEYFADHAKWIEAFRMKHGFTSSLVTSP